MQDGTYEDSYPPDITQIDQSSAPDQQEPIDLALDEDLKTADGGGDILQDVTTQDTEVTIPVPAPALYPSEQIHSPISTFVTARLQEIASSNGALNDAVFMKVGASTTVSNRNLKCLADPDVDLVGFADLQDTLDFFLGGDADGSDPFTRTTKAAKSGYSAGWAISGDPSPIGQEIEDIMPRFALIHYGTNDMGLGSTYESAMYGFCDNMMDLADQLIEDGIIPMFFGIVKRGDSQNADRWVHTYNAIIRAIAQANQVPFVDVHYATQDLPGAGLASDGIHLNTYKVDGSYDACDFSDDGLQFGFNVRNIISLQALDRVLAAAAYGQDSDSDPLTLSGDGSPQDPFLIEQLPFSDARSTAESPHQNLNQYTGCGAEQDESGAEFLYQLTLTTPTRLRAIVFDRGDVDIDVHLLDETATEESCLQRDHRIVQGTLAPGTYTFSLDTFVSNAGEQDGPYLFLIVACHPDDTSCDEAILR